MPIRLFAYVLLAVFCGVFGLANWSLLGHPMKLNMLLGTVTWPLGLVLLLVVLAVLAIDLSAHEWQRLAWSRERRQLIADRDRIRALAEQAEQSRISAVRALIERESEAIRTQLDRILARLPAEPGGPFYQRSPG